MDDAAAAGSAWPHGLAPAAVIEALGVDMATGLTTAAAHARLAEVGPNELEAAPTVPWWRRFLTQFTELLPIILLIAAAVAFVVSGELKTPIVVLVVVLVNAVIGVVQEHRAERSVEALREMLVATCRARRDGADVEIPATDLVPGDVVIVEAGNRVPADGRVVWASHLEVEEAALTGESQPTSKTPEPVPGDQVSIGDRSSMLFMNTTVTRGRGEVVVTATGMNTEIGRIAGLLRRTVQERSPLQIQLDGLARSLAALAGVVVASVATIGLVRGDELGAVLLTAVALAVAAIPEGLPAVTAITLALGVGRMARQHAIVKRLASVETLGCTTVVCSDKTGTLTLNQMTAVRLGTIDADHVITGRGGTGAITPEPGEAARRAVRAGALCNDATVCENGDTVELIGDPTEGALVSLAATLGIDVDRLRADETRIGEVPFDSATKLMITVHDTIGPPAGVRVVVKGALDVLMPRCTMVAADTGDHPLPDRPDVAEQLADEMAAGGLRVLAIAERRLTGDDWNTHRNAGGDDLDLARELTLLGLVGLVDPPRSEAAAAITEARRAGIDVKMITGDHATTAAAIAADLGIDGGVCAGNELDTLDDDELDATIEHTGVFARVAPEHKLRIVAALQRRGHVVAMTGDGVNDAPALKKADIGIAMGRTGTEVTKEAATMVLADDNFATIITAVHRGRAIYDNIVNFVRFQLSTTVGFSVLFLAAAITGIGGGTPFTAIAILWVNLIMDGPPALALGLDPASPDVMRRHPRPTTERILTPRRWTAIAVAAATMAAGTLAVLAWAPGPAPEPGTPTVAGTMALNTFVLYQFFNILNVRHDTRSVFNRTTLTNRWLWLALVAVLTLQIGVTHVGPLQRLFGTTSISGLNWIVCITVASTIIWIEETRKMALRRAAHATRSQQVGT